jgi:hypothetical protein
LKVELSFTGALTLSLGLKWSEFSAMLRLSKKTDYAPLALQHLASEGTPGTASARAIAERFGIPFELLAKILQQLLPARRMSWPSR